MDGTLVQLLRHKTWATLLLIQHCRGFQAGQLDATIPGTYGTIRETLRHLVASDESYLSQLTGIPEPEAVADAPDVLDGLAQHFRRSASRWEPLVTDADLPVRDITAPDGWRFPAAVLMAQAIHHADDHRTQVLSILGARGLEIPRVSVWDYARSHDLLWEPTDQSRSSR